MGLHEKARAAHRKLAAGDPDVAKARSRRAKAHARRSLALVVGADPDSLDLTAMRSDDHPMKVGDRPSYRAEVDGIEFVVRPTGDEAGSLHPGGYEVFAHIDDEVFNVATMAQLGRVLEASS